MSDEKQYPIGRVGWADLTVTNADEMLTFYQDVIGWKSEGLEMTDDDETYHDYVMKDESGEAVAGVCHQRGQNADIPSMWMIYVPVADVSASAEKCVALGGEILKKQANDDGGIQYVIIKDPAGAIMALTPSN